MEGSNWGFWRKFWNQFEVGAVDEIDQRLVSFNDCTRRYLQYEPLKTNQVNGREFTPKIYFFRQVQQAENGSHGDVQILGETIEFPTEYVKFYILGKWNLRDEKLMIRFEEDKQSAVIREVNFLINERSKAKCTDL
jgi:hypothetical protein